jgi:DNA-binding MarR family transcriptional regulator
MDDMDDERLSRSPLHLLHRVGQYADELFVSEMTSFDITPRQFTVLWAISKEEGLSQTMLVKRTGIDRSTIADLVQRIHAKGFVQRRRNKHDARAYSVSLTERGWLALRAAEPVAIRVGAKLLATLPEAQVAEFVANLSAIVGTFAESAAEAGR